MVAFQRVFIPNCIIINKLMQFILHLQKIMTRLLQQEMPSCKKSQKHYRCNDQRFWYCKQPYYIKYITFYVKTVFIAIVIFLQMPSTLNWRLYSVFYDRFISITQCNIHVLNTTYMAKKIEFIHKLFS